MNQNQQENKPGSLSFILFAALHLVCCALPLLLLAGVSFTFVSPVWPIAGGILIALCLVGLIRYGKRGCATCHPDKEKTCSNQQS